jgi:5-methylcytosine-specific restriction endonuclease McrA
MAADPKPQARIKDPDLMRLMHAEPTRECAVTGSTLHIELHHVLPRAQGGDDVRENLVFLHRIFHQAVTVNDPVALKLLGEYIWAERADTIAYLVFKMGKDRAVDWMRRRLMIEEAA